MTPRRSRFVGNTAALIVSTVVATGLTFAQMKILAAALPLAAFGLFASLRGLSLLIAMLAANGFPQVLTRFLPEHAALHRRAAAARLTTSALAGTALACLLMLAGVIAARSVFFAAVPTSELGLSFLLFFSVTTLAVALKLVLYGGFNGLRRFGAQTGFETGALALQTVWMAHEASHLTVERLFVIVGVTSMGVALVALPWFVKRLRRDVAESPAAPASPSYRDYWWGALGLSVVALAFSDADRWVLSNLLALEALSLFHVASRIARLANRFIAIPVLAFQPEVTRVDSEGRAEVVALSTRAFFKASVVAAVFAAAAIALYADDLIMLVASAEYVGARSTLWLLAASIPLTAMTAPLTAVMKALDGVRAAFYCDLAWALVYLVLLTTLASRFGVVGAGIAQLAACTVQLVLAARLASVRPSAAAAVSSLTKSLASAAAAFAPAAVAGALHAPRGLIIVLAILAPWIYVRSTRRLRVFTPEERVRLVQVIEGRGLARAFAWWMP